MMMRNAAVLLAIVSFAASTPRQPAMPTIRIVAIGDSTTAGTPAFSSPVEAPPNGRGDVTSQYAYWLMKAHPEWEVLNRGVNGERSDQIAARFGRHVIDARPAVTVIIAGVNDVYQGRATNDVTRHLRQMYDAAAREGIRVVAGTIIPYNTATAEQNAKMHAVNAWIRRQADDDPNIEFVDTRAAVSAPGRPDFLVSSPDELHPSPEGYRLMAVAIAPAIRAALKR
ncbi:MAG TPA: GDSL-type esterase/lipase family protein [Vicinamibacterales bacterium]|nr:GDSL-type esterase/lipase family protein [Vicinamibacterales bacterium]